uniref:Uncharacterized protein n=1 Tax=Globodera rostochiensis TaxID=31243 RepID=A0A914IDB6_GLORO
MLVQNSAAASINFEIFSGSSQNRSSTTFRRGAQLLKTESFELLHLCLSNTPKRDKVMQLEIPLGIMFLTLGLICEILYIPCMVAMRTHMDNTC